MKTVSSLSYEIGQGFGGEGVVGKLFKFHECSSCFSVLAIS